jgi:two-component system NtrC family response regulator
MNLLIVEDDTGLHAQYKWGITGFNIAFAIDRKSALAAIRKKQPDVVLLDLGLPPDEDNATEGLAVLNDISSQLPNTKVVVLTGSEQHEHALQAAALGAYDYLQKGVSTEELQFSLDRAGKMQQLEMENRNLRESKTANTQLIGNSTSMNKALKMLARIAPMPMTTLLSGESGTGKEMFAMTIHDMSTRKGHFVAINCASIPGDLLESELFGHEKGAFTGAHRRKIGKVEQAAGGTLFLDEIGDMPMELQSKMLRFLQERKIERVGGNETIPVDVRVVCATHRNLKEMTIDARFREDLYFRLAEYTLNIPALRERDDDVWLLSEYLLAAYRQEFTMIDSSTAKGFSRDALTAMLEHDWPGNVRELQNRIKGALVNCDSALINSDDLGLVMKRGDILIPDSWFSEDCEARQVTLDEIRKSAESKALYRAYRQANGNISNAAKLLDITRPTFYTLLEKFDMRIKQEG